MRSSNFLHEVGEKKAIIRRQWAGKETQEPSTSLPSRAMTQWETFGAALAIVASVVSNLGVNVQKYSHASEARVTPVRDQRPYVRRPLWWLGLALVIFGSLGDFTAFGFATQSLVAALGGGATLVANVFTAYFLNKEALYLVRSLRVWVD